MNTPLSTRRAFLQKGLTILAVAPTVPAFLDRTVWAMADPLDDKAVGQPSGADGKVLVVVQLSGGNDGLNTIVPYADDVYHRARPGLKVNAKDVLRLDDYLGLHPNLKPLEPLYKDKWMSIVQGVGYPNPNRSHFRSMDVWHSAAPEKDVVTTGWLGRYFDNACPGCAPSVGVSIGETMPLSMKGERVTPLSFEKPESYRYNGPDRERYLKLHTVREGSATHDEPVVKSVTGKKRGNVIVPISPLDQLNFLTRTAMDAQLSSDDILRKTRAFRPTAEYPRGEFGDGLRTVAAMIAGELPTRVYYVSLGGFDTHANQRGRHDNLMTEFASGVSAFWQDLKAQKNDGRVLMMCFSEFGRRVAQNASGGTDHGAAAPMFLFGPAVKQPIVGRHPSLA
ncbi:MAG: DUF1501 domain-containing protein, partial [Tepidisphaeraceae bacterium]